VAARRLIIEVPLFIALTAVLAVAAYHLIEEPLVGWGGGSATTEGPTRR
jgi:peptidoglycan/LPS O-acetylase OafA/YrhL